MALAYLILCSRICRFSSSFLVAVPAVQSICQIPALLLLVASFVEVVAWYIELSLISSPGIALGGNLLFLEEAFNFSMTLVYTMVTFTLNLDFPLPLLCSERVCSFIFSSYSSDSSPKHIKRYRETISPSRSSTVIMIPLLLCTCFIPDFYIFGAAIMTFEHSSLSVIEYPWILLTWF